MSSRSFGIESFRRLEEQRTPYVLRDRKFVGLAANFAGVDDEAVGVLATEHLIQNGCRVIAHIAGPGVSAAVGRLEGYQRAQAQHGMVISPQCIVSRTRGDDTADVTGREAMKRLPALDPRPDGVFCYNDPTAMGAMQAILEAGLHIPEDVAVVGCGNVRYSEFLRVPLTTVDQDCEGIGEGAAKLALSLVESRGPVRPKEILVEPKLIVRESSRKVAPPA